MTRRDEIWLPFPLCTDYLISSYGRVKSIEREYDHPIMGKRYINEKFLSIMICNHGYARTQLSIDRVKSKWYVHRLVAITFIPNPESKPQINHKNGNRNDNRIENLEWCTNQENNLHSYRELGRQPSRSQLGRSGKMHHASKRVYCPTLEIYFDSARIASKELGISQGSISNVCVGKQSHVDGLTFKYVLN